MKWNVVTLKNELKFYVIFKLISSFGVLFPMSIIPPVLLLTFTYMLSEGTIGTVQETTKSNAF